MNIENKKDKEIIEKVLNILKIEYKKHKYFNDGVSSKVILLNDLYLIKQNAVPVLQAEIEFLEDITSEFFQKIIYIDPDYEFIVYNFINGETMKQKVDVNDTIKKIIDITSNYSNYPKEGFGYLNKEVDTWSEFLKDEIKYSSLNLTSYIPDTKIVTKCVKILENYHFTKKLLHGDFGTHNFIQQNGKLVGIIDPMPVIGDYLYDVLFAIVSNTTILSNITLDKLYCLIDEPKEKINAMLTIVLYSRISRCLKYHPNDINIYISFWNTIIK